MGTFPMIADLLRDEAMAQARERGRALTHVTQRRPEWTSE